MKNLIIDPVYVLAFGVGVVVTIIHPLLGVFTYALLLFVILREYFKSK